jgi:hypothetical protein
MLTIIIWMFLIGTALPLTWLWRSAEDYVTTRIGISILSASFLWLVAGAAYAPAAGPNYSDIRLILINTNIAGIALVGIFLLFRSGAKIATTLTCIWLALGWLYLRAVSFAV